LFEEPPSSPYRAALVFAVVDTNILLMDLHIVSAIVNWGSLSDGHFRRVIVVVPWIVFQVGGSMFSFYALNISNSTI